MAENPLTLFLCGVGQIISHFDTPDVNALSKILITRETNLNLTKWATMKTYNDELPFHILIADDDHDDVVIVREALHAMGELIHIDHVVDGQSLIELLLIRKSQTGILVPI